MNYGIDNVDDDLHFSPKRSGEYCSYNDNSNIEHDNNNDDINETYIYDNYDDGVDPEDEIKQNLSMLKTTDKKSELEIQYLTLNNSGTLKESFSMLSVHDADKGEVIYDKKYISILQSSFDEIYPLFYLTTDQRKYLQENIQITKFTQKTLLYSGIPDLLDNGNDFSCFILLSGEIHIYNNKQTFIDLITEVTLFGYDGPIFNKRISTVIIEKDSVVGIISKDVFLHILQPFSQFATFISRNIRYKDKVLDSLSGFRNYVLSYIDKGPIDVNRLIKLYKKFLPCLHPLCNNNDKVDIMALTYALNRLPCNVFETYVYILTNKAPKLLVLDKELTSKLMPKQKTSARNRDVYKYLDGKSLVVVKDLETDVLDFVCNLCIYIIETEKIRRKISSPVILKQLHNVNGNYKSTVLILNEKGIEINEKESMQLFNVVGNSLGAKLEMLCVNHLDISIKIEKSPLSSKDPIELWTQNLWKVTKTTLGCPSWLTEIKDLVVDIFQGSRRTLLNCISPHIYINKQEILSWASKAGVALKTKTFINENDKLIAYAYYYYQAFPQMEMQKRKMNKEFGIEIVERTFGTGVHIIVINVNKYTSQCKQYNLSLPHITHINAASKNHIILHIGYTFGNQSHELIKPVLMLYGGKLRSINIIGKCGGLIGKQGDVMISTRTFLDKTHDVASVKNGNVDINELQCLTNSTIHVGPFLTVAGTILQNERLLQYYKIVMGCIGIDMDSYYYVHEAESSIKHKLLSEDFVMRCVYYVVDVPIDPKQILTNRKSDDHWEEGIRAVNAVERYLLNKVLM